MNVHARKRRALLPITLSMSRSRINSESAVLDETTQEKKESIPFPDPMGARQRKKAYLSGNRLASIVIVSLLKVETGITSLQ
jgi:hypothetical protein